MTSDFISKSLVYLIRNETEFLINIILMQNTPILKNQVVLTRKIKSQLSGDEDCNFSKDCEQTYNFYGENDFKIFRKETNMVLRTPKHTFLQISANIYYERDSDEIGFLKKLKIR